jgi:hypothetical protein
MNRFDHAQKIISSRTLRQTSGRTDRSRKFFKHIESHCIFESLLTPMEDIFQTLDDRQTSEDIEIFEDDLTVLENTYDRLILEKRWYPTPENPFELRELEFR